MDLKYLYSEPLPNSECSERKFEWIRICKSCWSKTHSLFRRLILLELRMQRILIIGFLCYCSCSNWVNGHLQYRSVQNMVTEEYLLLLRVKLRIFISKNNFSNYNFVQINVDFINPELSMVDVVNLTALEIISDFFDTQTLGLRSNLSLTSIKLLMYIYWSQIWHSEIPNRNTLW